MIEYRNIHKTFGDLEVLKGIDFKIETGEVVCILGPSGSGKTTLLRCTNFLETPARGALVDSDALIAALESGHLAGAGLDVVEGDQSVYYRDHGLGVIPHRQKAILDAMPNVLMLPHLGYLTDQALLDMVENSLRAARAWMDEDVE